MIRYIWSLLESSSLTWQGMADDVNANGFRRLNGKPFGWNDLYRIGQNPHYAGMLRFDLYVRDKHDGTIKRQQPLRDQNIVSDTGSAPEPYISPETFWSAQERRYNHQTRYHLRAKNGCSSELTGLLRCPECGNAMSSYYQMSGRLTGHGNPRRSPRKYYYYQRCAAAQGSRPTCGNRKPVRVEHLSKMLVELIAETASMSDEAIVEALQLHRSKDSIEALEAERRRLVKSIETAKKAKHELTKLFASGAMTQAEVEADLFEHRRDRATAEARIRDIDVELARQHPRPDFKRARSAVSWLVERWTDLTVWEKAEALRLLVDAISYEPNGTVYPDAVRILAYGRAFLEPAAVPGEQRDLIRKSS